jgi:L-lactate dehydrogenase complex protein LldG
MSARDDILNAIRSQRVKSSQRPAQYRPPAPPADLVGEFTQRAEAVNAEVRLIDGTADIPAAIADLLRAKNLPAVIHLPPDAALANLNWESAPGLTLTRQAPGPDDTALAFAPFGIAETGTLTYPAGNAQPASWHFRAGFEIAVLRAADILPHMENALGHIKLAGALPHTINFVSGPSRTGDIEQTLELGAHGPKSLAVLIVRE